MQPQPLAGPHVAKAAYLCCWAGVLKSVGLKATAPVGKMNLRCQLWGGGGQQAGPLWLTGAPGAYRKGQKRQFCFLGLLTSVLGIINEMNS